MSEALEGNDLQIYINKILPELAKEEWPDHVRSAVRAFDAEAIDHKRRLITYADVGRSTSVVMEHIDHPPERIESRTREAVAQILREQLRALIPQIEDAIHRNR